MREDSGEKKNLALEMPENVDELTALFRRVVERSLLDGKGWWKQLPWPEG